MNVKSVILVGFSQAIAVDALPTYVHARPCDSGLPKGKV